MHTNDVHHRLLPVGLAIRDEGIEDNPKGLTKRQKLLTMPRSFKYPSRLVRRSISTVVPNPTCDLRDKYPNAREVRIRLVFIHIGEIDTLNEKYHADIYLEARWTEKRMNLSSLCLTSQQQTQLYENSTVKVNELNPAIHWSPQLFIENAIGQIGGQEKRYTIRKTDSKSGPPSSPLCIDVDICEHRRMRGIFWEKLELSHFPADVQDLTISITSQHHVENCILIQDKQYRSSINREAFVDQQEWSLYEHVATEVRETNEDYSFENENNAGKQNKHPVLAVTCRAARQPGYYYWNGFFLIFLITICSFCIFAILPNIPQSRLQTTCTLVLTSITFRWVVNRSLPQISYLTTLDIYAIISIIILVILCMWHSIIATVIFYNSVNAQELGPSNTFVMIDRFVFISLFTMYVVIHIILFIWLITVPYNRRREMERLDREYAAKKYIELNTSLSQYGSKQELGYRRSSSVFEGLPTMKPMRMMRQISDGVTVIANNSTFIPIQEATNEIGTTDLNMNEFRKQDDTYYD